jgi:hypothetical protein
MQRRGLLGLLYLLLAAVIVLPQAIAVSAWSGDPTVNTPICADSLNQTHPQLIPDGSGGAIITWEDSRSGSTHIYAQRVNGSGATQWTGDGVAICTAAVGQVYPQLIPDGAGGVIITWEDSRGGVSGDIYAQWVNSSGVVQWTPADGVPICTNTSSQIRTQIISDNAGGAIITWQDDRNGYTDIYAQWVNSSGVVKWIDNGSPICTYAGDQAYPQLISDDTGGAIITWQDGRGSSTDIYAQRVNSSGATQWTPADGVPICTATQNQEYPQLISDDAGGAIITWDDSRGSTNWDVYAQRMNASGATQWTDNGSPICTATQNQNTAQLASDGAGGAIITWRDWRSGFADIYARRVDSSGAVQWNDNGSAICTASDAQWSPQITSDGSHGAIITWQDFRSGTWDIYARRVNAGGAVQWTDNGSAICTAANGQWSPQLISDGAGGAIITWEDWRSGSYYDIYAQRVYSSGSLDPRVTLTTSSTPGGNVTAPGEVDNPYTYNCSQVVTINATPDACCHFVSWTGTGVDAGKVANAGAASTTITMSDNYSVQANFAINTYTLTYSAGTGGSITGMTTQTRNCGADGSQVTAIPDSCYHFLGWNDGLGTASRTDTNVTTDITVAATFAINTFTITVAQSANGTISPGTTMVGCGAAQVFSITPAACYHVATLTVDGSPVTPVGAYTFTNVQAAHTITATFAVDTFTVTVAQSANGTISPGTTMVGCGAAQVFSITPAACYHVATLTVDGSPVTPVGAYTFTNVQAAHTITATFATNTFQLTTSSTSGGHVTTPGEVGNPYTYDCGTVQNIVATNDSSYHFVNWTGSGVTAGKVANANTASTTINMSDNYAVQANFTDVPRTLSTSSTSGGDVTTPGEADSPYAYYDGQVINIVATNDSCCHFVSWTGSGVTAGKVANAGAASTAITMDANYSVQASFAINTYTLTYSAGTGGSITGTTTQTVNCGADGSQVQALPDSGYYFVQWSDNVTNASRKDTNVTANLMATASFATNTYTPTPTQAPTYTRTSTIVPELIYPQTGDTINDNAPSFQWTAVGEATSYRIQVATDPGFGPDSIVIDEMQEDISSFMPSRALPDGEYYWHVEAHFAEDEIIWSDTGHFRIKNEAFYQSDFRASVPLPTEISTDPKVIGTNALLTLILVLIFYLAATLFNSTVRENYHTIQRWFRPLRKLLGSRSLGHDANKKYKAKLRRISYLTGLEVVLITALFYCFLDPYFIHGLGGLALFGALFISIGIVTFFYEGIQMLWIKYRCEVPAVFTIRPISLVIAAAFVIISRLVHFHPGLTFGFVGACMPLLGTKKLKRDQRAKSILVSALLLSVVSAIVFVLRMPVHDAMANDTNFWLSLLDMILVAVFIIGLEGLVFTLVPLIFMDGYKVFRWKWWAWGITFTIVLALFIHLIINKDGEIKEAVGNANVIMMFGLTGASLVLSFVIWLYFLIRQKPASKQKHE